jgi:hypothetical protein
MALLMPTRGAATLAALLLVAAGCQPAPTELRFADDQVVLHSVLLAGADAAAVVIMRMERGAEDDRFSRLPVHGAVVQLIAGADTISLVAHANAPDCELLIWMSAEPVAAACYAAPVPGGIRAGDRYKLRVRLPDGRMITGATTVPALPVLVEPGTDAVFTARNTGAPPSDEQAMRVTWEPLPAGHRAELFTVSLNEVCVVMLPEGLQFGRYLHVTGRDSVSVAPVVACREGGLPASLSADVGLAVYDENYSRYATDGWASSSVRDTGAAAGVEGAWGLFGAVAQVRQRVLLVLAPDQ